MDKIINHPWAFQVEPVTGCTRLCRFCGLNLQRKKPGNFKFMPLEVARKIANDGLILNTNARIELAMNGEPLVHPEINKIIMIFRNRFPKTQIQLTTNGNRLIGRMEEKINKLFESGLDILVLDTYLPERDKLQKEIWNNLKGFNVVDFYNDWAKKGLSPWNNHHRKYYRTVIVVDDISLHLGERKNRMMHNYNGGNLDLPVPKEPLEKTCVIPFRGMSINANGSICICCNDSGRDYICGNVMKKSLNDIWYGNRFRTARRYLRNKMRFFSPCIRCDCGGGSRSGLLPKYPLPIEKDRELIRKIIFSGKSKNILYKPKMLEKLIP